MIEERVLNKDILASKIDEIINDDKKQKEISKNLRKLSIDDSASIIYNEIKKIVK